MDKVKRGERHYNTKEESRCIMPAGTLEKEKIEQNHREMKKKQVVKMEEQPAQEPDILNSLPLLQIA